MSSRVVNTWLYAVVELPAAELPKELTGVAGEVLRLLTASGSAAGAGTGAGGAIAAVAGSVPRSEFDEDALNAHLREPEWLERAVRDHHRVVCRLGETHHVLPMRFATLCQDDARAAELLAERHDELVAALDHVRGRSEWGVKAWAGPRSDEAADPDGTEDVPADSGRPGTAYLSRLRDRRSRRERDVRRAVDEAERVRAQLDRLAVECVEHPLQSQAATGRADPMVLNGACLVDDLGTDVFVEALTGLSGELSGLALELTGPWPPYSFTEVGPSDAGEGAER